MIVKTNIPLSEHTSMKLGGNARFMAEATTIDELIGLYQNAKKLNQLVMIIGGGSNMIVHDEGFNGLVIQNRIPGFEVTEENSESTTIHVGSGESWDGIVAKSVDLNLSGIEALSSIPGTMGAAPVQNIGAYGQEIADVLVSVEAYDTRNDSLVRLSWEDCNFSYRDSIFRSGEPGRYVIIGVTVKLYKKLPVPPFYKALQEYLDNLGITEYNPRVIRDAVVRIRANKLPDPTVRPNAGSFFKNVIVEAWQLNDLQKTYSDMPGYKMDDEHYKIPAGWLIEEAGFKGNLIQGVRVHDGNALVLINESATGYADLAAARDEIVSGVRDKFRVTLEQEPLEV